MKKLLVIAVCCMLFCGCGNSFEASEFNWETPNKFHSFFVSKGAIKNNSSEDCQILNIELSYQNGDLQVDDTCVSYEIIKAGKTGNVKCLYHGNIDNIIDYKIDVKEISCID